MDIVLSHFGLRDTASIHHPLAVHNEGAVRYAILLIPHRLRVTERNTVEATPDKVNVGEIIALKEQQMLFANPEYQRGAIWRAPQKKKLIDSVLRGYPIPLIYLHHISQSAAGLTSERFEIIDGQQRINALADFKEGGFKLFDPVKDAVEARFPEFIKRQECPWAGLGFPELSRELKAQFLATPLQIVKITVADSNEARDLFVRLQAGIPLNSQEKRDAWPGQFTEFVLKLGGKPNIPRYPGHDFFNVLMKANRVLDRGKFRQLAAQIAMLFFAHRKASSFCDINSSAIDDFYYEHLDFDAQSQDAQRLMAILDELVKLLGDQKRKKILGHEAIHLVLLVDSLLDDYTPVWKDSLAHAFDHFRENLAHSQLSKNSDNPNGYWLRYGVGTRANSDRKETIAERHHFFVEKMRSKLHLQVKDSKRTFGTLERELIYYRDHKQCAQCDGQVFWADADIHHIEPHHAGGKTELDNAVLVHRQCHPKGTVAEKAFAEHWRLKKRGGHRSVSANA